MHAIWFSIFVPALVATVWIWTKLRLPTVWWVLSLIAVIVAVLWVGNDLLHFAQVKGSFENAGLRVLYLFLSEPDKPVLQLAFGFLMAGLLSLRLSHRADEPIIAEQ